MRKILLPPVIFALCLFGIVAINRFGAAQIVIWSGLGGWLDYIFFAAGFALPIWGAYIFRRHDTNIKPYKDPEHIVTSGPFAFSRNPMYLGLFLMLTGAVVRYGTLESLLFPAVFFVLINWWQIPYEEERMTEIFGDEFAAYKARVRRWL